MKLSIKDIKSRLSQKPVVVRPSVHNFPYFSAEKLDISPYQICEEL